MNERMAEKQPPPGTDECCYNLPDGAILLGPWWVATAGLINAILFGYVRFAKRV